MSKAAQLIDVSRNELFPSAEMILALGREFGVTSLEKVMEETDEGFPLLLGFRGAVLIHLRFSFSEDR